jgi:hypothetical protein
MEEERFEATIAASDPQVCFFNIDSLRPSRSGLKFQESRCNVLKTKK